MELKNILERLKEPEKIIDPEDCNIISSYISGWITDYEETLNELNLRVSVKWQELREKNKSDAKTERDIELTDVYQDREQLKLKIAQLRRLRSDLKDRFQVLTNKKRY